MSRRDKQLLSITGGCVVLLIALIAVFGPPSNDSGIPSSYSNALHGARAAWLLLEKSGYRVTRSVEPLGQVAQSMGPGDTLVLADPFYEQVEESREAVKQILARGGRVVVTGWSGGNVAPHKGELRAEPQFWTCTAQPTGLSGPASSGAIRMGVEAMWETSGPDEDVAYRCGDGAVVVTYPSGKGTVVWWASSSPLENGTISDEGNMALLLNSIGAAGTRVIWDESLHGESPSLWSYAAGTVLPWVWVQCGAVALLLLFSFSRRSGPLRPDPAVVRATPLEFVRSLGSLYRKAGATNVAVSVAYQAFRLKLERTAGVSTEASPESALATMERRYPGAETKLQPVLETADRAANGSPIREKAALGLVRALQAAERELS